MNPRVVERIVWCATAGAVAAGLIAWRGAVQRPVAQPPVIWPIARAPDRLAARSLDSAAAAATRSDPFRLERRPASVAFGAEPVAVAAPPPEPPKPTLSVAGIVGGPPWVALVDGVPGHGASVLVHAGDTLAGLRVRTVSRTTVTIAGLDTTWKLTLKRPWK